MFDNNIMLRAAAAGNVTEDADLAFVDFGGPDLLPREYMISVPAAGADTTMDLTLADSTDGTNADGTTVTVPQITAAGVYYVRAQFKGRYRRVSINVGGTGTINFGAVEIGPVPGGRYEKF